jgi:uncharacterized protein with HEPN domain
MLDFANRAVEFITDKSRGNLETDVMRSLAIAHLVEMMGNAARIVPDEFRRKYPEVPWAQITAAGERLSPGDGEVDLDVIWTIVNRDLPPLIAMLRRIIREEG